MSIYIRCMAFDFNIFDTADGSLHKASTLVIGENDVVLVDTTFTRTDGLRLVEAIRATGKRLQTVVITAPDPDYYFAADVVADAFPEARFVAPADVVAQIKNTYNPKLQAWAHLGDVLPRRLVEIEPLDGPVLLDGGELQVRRDVDELGTRSWYVFEPQSRAIVGGVLLFGGLHVWTADTATPGARKDWLRALDALTALDPALIVAGHRQTGYPADASAVAWTRDYLELFEAVIADSADAAAAVQKLLQSRPDAGLEIAANLGTKVAKGELVWG